MEERHRSRYWGGEEEQRMELPCLPRHITLPAPRGVDQPGSFLNFIVQEFYRAQSPALPLSFLEVGGWGRKFQHSNHLVFLVTSPILRLSRDPTLIHITSINSGITKDTPITQEIPRVLGALCQELGAKTKYIFVLGHRSLCFCISFWAEHWGHLHRTHSLSMKNFLHWLWMNNFLHWLWMKDFIHKYLMKYWD